MSTDRPRHGLRRGQAGLSLVELLVGVVVGMIGILIIFQTMAVWDKHARTTTSGGDVRTAGVLATYNFERDLKLAGMGFGTADVEVMGCPVATQGVPTFDLMPVAIRSSASGPDSIDVLYGNSAFFVSTERFTNVSNVSKKMKRRGGFKAGDLAIVAGNGASAASANCHLIQVTDVSDPDGVTLLHAASAPYNGASGTGAVYSNGTMYNLGPDPRLHHWAVVDGSLVTTDRLHAGAPTQQIADGVVDFKAQYGYDLDGDSKISGSEWTATPPAPIEWNRVLAVLFAVLVRSRQFEKDADTPYLAASAAAPPTWFGTVFTMRDLNGLTDTNPASSPNNWRYYRYRVYERVVPLRNMIWGATS